MRTQFLRALVALGGIAAFGTLSSNAAPPGPGAAVPPRGDARPERPPEPPRGERGGRGEAEHALREYYGPTAQHRIIHESETNGVKVYEAVVSRDGAEAQATVTADGQLLATGLPQQIGVITPAAQATAQLFRTPPISISQEEIHGYWVSLSGPNKKPFIIEMDATGRIRDIESPEQLRENAPRPDEKVAGPAEHQMREMATKRFNGVQVDLVDIAIHDPGYFQVGFRNGHGQGWAIMNTQNDVTQWRMPIDRKDVPEAVRRTIERDFHGDRITRLARGSDRVYRIVQNIGGEEVIMQVAPDGAVVWINSRALHIHHESK